MNNNVLFALCVLLFSLLMFCVAPAFGDNYYVAASGNDGNGGTTWDYPKLTIQAAIDVAQDGDVVSVSNGTYKITIPITITSGVTVQSTNGPLVTLIMPDVSFPTTNLIFINHANARMDGFTIANGKRRAVNIRSAGTLANCVVCSNLSDNNAIHGTIWLENGGLVQSCLIRNNRINSSGGAGYSGGGVYLNQGGLVDSCVIISNRVDYGSGSGAVAGGVYINGVGGKVRNSLIMRNFAQYNGSGVYCDQGNIESCTIVDNFCSNVFGVGLFNKNGTCVNTIVYGNTNENGLANYENSGAACSYSYCCVYPGLAGIGNTQHDPCFADIAGQNYSLLPGPCVNAGLNQDWMLSASDITGNPRIVFGTVDMGAYEYTNTALRCSFEGSPTLKALASNEVVFTATVSGGDRDDIYYSWRFTNGAASDVEGQGKFEVTNLYGPGLYTVRLDVTDGVGGSDSMVRSDYIKVGPEIVYVATNGPGIYPYSSWATATSNIHNAVYAATDGSLVLVSNGVYGITNQIEVRQKTTMRSIGGAEATEIRRVGSGTHRIFILSHTNAEIDGFTIANAKTERGSVYIDRGGIVKNCIIRDKEGFGSGDCGAGVFMLITGCVQNCRIFNNINQSTGGGSGQGGGIYMTGGKVESCYIYNNKGSTTGSGSTGYGGGIWMSGGIVRDCMIFSNSHNRAAGGVYISGGILESCTVANNVGTNYGVLITNAQSTVRNTIFSGNRRFDGVLDNWYCSNLSTVKNCATLPIAGLPGSGHIEVADPLFRQLSETNCSLRYISPCVNAGLNQDWMLSASDITGNPRIHGAQVDIGAYESQVCSGTIFKLQ